MQAFFFYGTLRHRPLLELVLGVSPETGIVPARLEDHSVHWVKDAAFPMIRAEAGAVAEGLLVSGLDAVRAARLDFYEGGFDFALLPVTVETDDGPRKAQVYFPEAGRWEAGAPWSLEDWERDWAAISLRAAAEAMSQFGRMPATDLARWLPQMRVRAATWVHAQGLPSPMLLRRGLTQDDVEGGPVERLVSRFFSVQQQDIRFRRFDGEMSDSVARMSFASGDAVTVLPYDPLRDRVMLIEQFRYGPLVRGDRHPWSLEPIAGRIDPGESAEEAARREAVEEACLRLGRLERIASYYPSPGAVTEYLTSYVGLADLPDGVIGNYGQESEAEDIRSLLLDFADFQDWLGSGEAENGPLILSAFWLAANRQRLRAEA